MHIYDPVADTWTLGSSLSDLSLSPGGSAITVENKLYYIDGNESGFSRMFVYDPNSDDWSQRSSMLQGRTGFRLVWFNQRIWAIGGWNSNIVESYDILTNTWRTETNLPEIRGGHVAWVAQDKIFVSSADGEGLRMKLLSITRLLQLGLIILNFQPLLDVLVLQSWTVKFM